MASINTMDKGVLRDCAAYLMEDLACLGIYCAYSSRQEATFKFTDKRIGSLRVASVSSGAYSYRWNIFMGENKEVATKYKTHWYPVDEAHYFVSRVLGYAETIIANSGEPAIIEPQLAQPSSDELPPLDAYEGET